MIAKTETLGGCKILRVSGRIDFESALDFEQHINAMIQEGGDCFIIELSQVELLSSAGLRVMLSTAKRVSHRNASLALAAPSQVVRQVFEISHFNLLFKIFPSVPAAITALKGTTEVDQTGAPVQDSLAPSDSDKLEETNFADPVIPSDETSAKSPMAHRSEAAWPQAGPSVFHPSPKIESDRSEPLPPVVPRSVSIPPSQAVLQPPALPSSAETLTGSPPPLPPVIAESGNEPTAAPLAKRPQGRQTPPASLPANQPVPVSATQGEPFAVLPTGSVTRREAKFRAMLEVRAEGASYPCKDGDVIGTEGRLAQAYFGQITNLAPRHLLIGQLDGQWFVFTPKNVQHPFILDGVVLRAGERKVLQYVEHQVEFSGHVFGFRLVAQQPKEGFFARVFGRKR